MFEPLNYGRTVDASGRDCSMPINTENTLDGVAYRRRMEIYAFLIVTALLMPALAVATVGAWGLTVWTYQAINGPPGPPPK